MDAFVYFATAKRILRRALVTIAMLACWYESKAAVAKPTVCWNSFICERIKRLILRQNLTRLFIGAPAKCAGTTVKEYLWAANRNDTKERQIFRVVHQKEKNCPYAITGAHLWGGLENMLKSPCSGSTLFFVPVRELVSWLFSAARQVCYKRDACTTAQKERMVFRTLPVELKVGPMDVIKESEIWDSRFHVLLVNAKSIMQILSCLPPGVGGVKSTQSTQQLASLIYFRSNPKWSGGMDFKRRQKWPEYNWSTPLSELFVIYNKTTNRRNWLDPYLEVLGEGGCEVGSWSPSSQLHR